MISLVAPALVLLHGFTQTRQSWRRTVRALGAGRYRALVPDLPGHGQAAHRTPSFDAVTAYVRALGPERFALAGYSMGGRIALHAALALQPRVERLGLVGASPRLADPAERAPRRGAPGGGGPPPLRRRRAGRPHRGDRRRGVRRGVGGAAAVRRPGSARGRRRARRPAAQHRGRPRERAARARGGPDGTAVGPPAGAGDPRHARGGRARPQVPGARRADARAATAGATGRRGRHGPRRPPRGPRGGRLPVGVAL